MSTLKQKVLSGELTPIIFLPMETAETCHINLGTGGNFVQNGTLDTASRGANQDNCVASYFNGTSQYLNKVSTWVDSKVCYISFIVKDYQTTHDVIQMSYAYGFISIEGSGALVVSHESTSGVQSFRFETNANLIPPNRTTFVQLCINMDNKSACRLYIDGAEVSLTGKFTSFITGTVLDFTGQFYIGETVWKGNIGELYFDTKYIDLSTSNPFWDADTNRPKPVRQVIRETGITPLIAMPLDASNAGKNYGTVGDFTANSAPYVGARGSSEFISRSVTNMYNSGANYLRKDSGSTTTMASPSHSIFVFTFKAISYTNSNKIDFFRIYGSADCYMTLDNGSGSGIRLYARLSPNMTEYQFVTATTASGWHTIMLSQYVQGNGTSSYSLYIDGVKSTSMICGSGASVPTWYKDVNLTCSPVDGNQIEIGNLYVATLPAGGATYFDSEANRNLFVSQLGYLRDLKPLIKAGTIPTPLIYLPFDDPTNLGKNLGTEGNFTVNGIITAGSDFSL